MMVAELTIDLCCYVFDEVQWHSEWVVTIFLMKGRTSYELTKASLSKVLALEKFN